VRGRHTEDTSSWGTSRSFTVIPYPILKSPANGDTNVNTQPLFSWEPMTGIDAYQLQYDTDPNFIDGFISPAIGDSLTSYRCPYILEKIRFITGECALRPILILLSGHPHFHLLPQEELE
jgi:hypothetical protein